MADSDQQADPIHVAAVGEPSIQSESAGEPQKEHDGASVRDQIADSEQTVATEREGQAQPARGGADAAECQTKEDSRTGDGDMGAQMGKSPLEQDTGVEQPGSGVNGSPKARETGQGEDHTAEESGGMGGPSIGIKSTPIEEQGSDAKDEDEVVKAEGDVVKDEGEVSKDEGSDVKAEGEVAKVEGDMVNDEGEVAKDGGGDEKAEDGVAKTEGDVSKDDGDVTKDKGVGEPAGEEGVGLSREEIIAHLREALATQEQLKALNAQYQHKIAEYLAKKKTEEKHDPTRSVTDQEQRYVKCMNALEALQQEYSALAENQCEEEAELVVESQHCLGLADKQRKEDLMFLKQKSLASVYTRTGKHMTAQEFERLAAEVQKVEGDVVQARLENIRLSTSIAKKEALIRKKEELGDGLHVIDFEQLKIDNVNLNEKIEERNEDLVKLRKKITGTVQVLTHVKEKLQFVQAENAEKKEHLTALEQSLSLKRDRLTRLKQARDALRMDNIKLRHQGGLVGHMDLLRDFEEQVDKNDVAASVIQSRQQQQSEALLACNRLQRKEATAAAWTQRGMV